MRKTVICREAFDTSFSHGLDQCHQSLLRNGIPLLLKELEQLSEVCCWGMIVMNTAAKDVPEVLDGCQIRGTGRQVHLSNLMLLKEASHHPSMMGSDVIMENRARSHCLQCGEDSAPYDLALYLTPVRWPCTRCRGVLPCRWIPPHTITDPPP